MVTMMMVMGVGGDNANSAPFTLLSSFKHVIALIFLTAKGGRYDHCFKDWETES